MNPRTDLKFDGDNFIFSAGFRKWQPNHPSQSSTPISQPNHPAQSSSPIIQPNHPPQSSSPIIQPNLQAQSSSPIIHPNHPPQSSTPIIHPNHQVQSSSPITQPLRGHSNYWAVSVPLNWGSFKIILESKWRRRASFTGYLLQPPVNVQFKSQESNHN